MTVILDIIHGGLLLSIPALFGFSVGYNWTKSEPVTKQHVIGRDIELMVIDMAQTLKFCGSGFSVQRTAKINGPDGVRVKVTLETETA